MKIRKMMTAAVAAIGIGVSAPAMAAPPNVQLAMASYASDVAGENAHARAKAKEEHHAAHVAQHRKVKSDCGECCSELGRCDDCDKADCAGGDCAEKKGSAAVRAAANGSEPAA